MAKFIDIHTHRHFHLSDIISIRSFLIGKEEVKTDNFFSVGCHPWYADIFSKDILRKITSLCMEDNCLAIGEIGLDKLKGKVTKQKQIFMEQLDLAQAIGKPVIIHSVRAYNEVLQLKKIYPNSTWIIHGFYGNKELAKQLIDKEIYLSIGYLLLREKSKLIDVLRNLPLDRMFFETDQWENSVKDIYFAASKILSMDIFLLQQHILENFKTVFNVQVV